MTEHISIADKAVFEKCRDEFYQSLGGENHISDLCFCNLFAWSDSLKTRRALIDGFFCVSIEFLGKWYHYAPIGKIDGRTKAYERVIDRLCSENNIRSIELIMVPEIFLPELRNLGSYRAEYSYDEDYSDYIYDNVSFERLLENRSNRYDYNHFKRNNAPSFQIINKQNKTDCLKIMEKFWCLSRDCGGCHFGCERKALQNAVTHFETLELSGALVYTEHEPAAFVIAKKLSPTVIAYHFMKANTSVRGLQLFLLYSFACEVHAEAGRINFTEDMGIIGLRSFKQRLAPFTQTHKYNVTLTR